MEEQKINKDLILREKLAIERTVMANQRTFLSFIRTSLYFAVAGLSIEELLTFRNEGILVAISFIISFLLLLAGFIAFLKQKKNIANSGKHIGNYRFDQEEDL